MAIPCAARFSRRSAQLLGARGMRSIRPAVSKSFRRLGAPPPSNAILCRNLAFTYFDRALQRETLARLQARLRRGGFWC
jgi:hypothetical protein